MERERFDPYRALGLPIGAGPMEIKRRFRQLARRMHPDVRVGDGRAHEQFITIKRAYDMLSDDDMRARLEAETLGGLDETIGTIDDFEATLQQAHDLTKQGRLVQAKGLCADMLGARPMEPRVFDLLAIIYDIEGNEALEKRMRQEAERIRGPRAEPAPTARAAARGREVQHDMWLGEPAPKRVWLGLVGIGAALACVAWVWVDAGGGVAWGFSRNEIIAAALAGLLGVGMLAASGLMGSFDLHLGAAVAPQGGAGVPLWLYLTAAGLVSTALALLFYAVTALLEQGFSKHVLALFGFVAATAAAMAWAHGGDWALTMLVGSNVILIGGMIGWGIGSTFRPGEWWQ